MSYFGARSKNWDAQVSEGIPSGAAFHSQDPGDLQHIKRSAIPSKNLAFVVIYFASRIASVDVQFSFEVSGNVKVCCSQ